MWSEAFIGSVLLLAAVLGLIPVAAFGRMLIQASAPDPGDQRRSPWDGWFPLRGRWRRLFFLGVEFVCIGPFIYATGVILALCGLSATGLIVQRFIESGGAR